MSQIVPANWASSKFGVQITQNTIYLVIKKRTDLECNTDNELFAKSQTFAHDSETEEDP